MNRQKHMNPKRTLLQERARRIIEEKYRYYIPIGKTSDFLDLWGSGKYITVVYSAANGVGKTTIIPNILANLFFPIGNKYFQQPLFLNWKFPLRKGRIVSDPTTVKTTIVPALQEWLPANRYTTENMMKPYPYRWTTDTGWEFDIMTYDQRMKEFESATLDFAFFDEPPPRAIYKATVARMRRGGVIGILMTPLDGSQWIYDDIITNQNNEEGYRAYITANVEDACREHGVRGFLEHDNILKMVAQYDDEDKQARIFGKFQHLTGMVFKGWDRKYNVIEPFDINFRDFVVIESMDTHTRTEDAIVWVAIDRKNRVYVIDEYFQNNKLSDLARAIKSKTATWRVIDRLLDPSAWIDDQHSETDYNSLAQQLARRHKLRYNKGSKRRMDAIKIMREALSWREVNGDLLKSPEVYIFANCQRLIYEIEHYQWDDWRGTTKERKDQKDRPVDKDDHLIEALGRILIKGYKYTEPIYQQEEYDEMVASDPFIRSMEKQLSNTNFDPYE